MLAPAMNRVMWANKATQANIETLVSRGVRILGPGSGNQACGEIGVGRMWEPSETRWKPAEPPANAGLLGRSQCIDHRGPHPRAPRSGALSHQSQLGKNGIRRGRRGPRGRRSRHHRHRTGAIADACWHHPHQRGERARHVRRGSSPSGGRRRVHRGGGRRRFSAGDDRQAENQETRRRGQPRPRARARHHQVGRRHGQASVRGRLCGRDQRRRGQCAQQTEAQEARHDRRQPGRRWHCLRLRGQCVDGDLAGRQRSKSRADRKSTWRASSSRSSPNACRRPTAARGAVRASAAPPPRCRATACAGAARDGNWAPCTPSKCGSWIRASAGNSRCRSMRRRDRRAWICGPASMHRCCSTPEAQN